MLIHRADLADRVALRGTVVVIDVLRSFSTAAYALAAGARALLAVDSADAARALRAADDQALAIGAVGGGAPAAGMDLGNSPSRVAGLDLRGRRVILCTAGGTRGLQASAQAELLLAAGLVNARATAALLLQQAPAEVSLLVTGTWTDRNGDEDHACADLIAALLRGEDPPRAAFEARVRESDFGRRFSAGNDVHLPVADLACCAEADRFDFAMTVQRQADGLLISRVDRSARPTR